MFKPGCHHSWKHQKAVTDTDQVSRFIKMLRGCLQHSEAVLWLCCESVFSERIKSQQTLFHAYRSSLENLLATTITSQRVQSRKCKYICMFCSQHHKPVNSLLNVSSAFVFPHYKLSSNIMLVVFFPACAAIFNVFTFGYNDFVLRNEVDYQVHILAYSL